MLINYQKNYNQSALQSLKSSFIKLSETGASRQASLVKKVALAVINLLLIPFRLAQGAYYRLLKVKSEPKRGFFNNIFDSKTSIRELNQSTILKTALVGVGAAGLIALGYKPSTQNSQMELLSDTQQFALGISSLPVIYGLNLLLSNKKENNELSFKDLPKEIIANISCFSDNKTAGSFNVATGLRYADYVTRKEALARETINKIYSSIREDVSRFEEIEQILSVKHLSYLEKLKAVKSLIENEIFQIEVQMLFKVVESFLKETRRLGLNLPEFCENFFESALFDCDKIVEFFAELVEIELSESERERLNKKLERITEELKRIGEEFKTNPTESFVFAIRTVVLRKIIRAFLEIIDSRKEDLGQLPQLVKSIEEGELTRVEETIKEIGAMDSGENIVSFIKSPLRTDFMALRQIQCADLLVHRFERMLDETGGIYNTEELKNNIKTIKDLNYPLAEKAVRINSELSKWFKQENINDNLTELSLTPIALDEGFSIVLIPCIFELTSLKTLDLRGTGLMSIPKELNKLENLEALNLEDNKLSFVPCVSGLKKLRILNLQQNRIRGISDNLFELNSLTELNLSINFLSKIPNSSFSKLNNLIILDLSNNLFAEIPNSIRDLTGLRQLSIEGNKISSIPDDFFEKLNTLTGIDLSSNLFTEIPNSIYRLGPPFRDSIIDIRLWGNRIKNVPNDLPDWLRPKIGFQYLNQEVPKSIFTKAYTLIRNLFSNN